MIKISNDLKDFPIKEGLDIYFVSSQRVSRSYFQCFSTSAQRGRIMTKGDTVPAWILRKRPRMT